VAALAAPCRRLPVAPPHGTAAGLVEEGTLEQGFGTHIDEQFRLAIEASPCAMILVGAEGSIALVNREAERLFGYGPGELTGQSIEVLVPESLRRSHRAQREEFNTAPRPRPMGHRRDLTGVRRDGTAIPIEIGLNPLPTSGGRYVLAAIVDLTERKRYEQRISHQAQELKEANVKLSEMAVTDSLTGAWNRRAFLDQLEIQMEMALRTTRPMSVLILDLDHFKTYNDEYGHLAGDDVLKRAARILRDQARRSDYVARIGGEEFAIILPETDGKGAVRLGDRFRGALEEAEWPRREVTASIGGATLVFETPDRRPDTDWRSRLLTDADRALYHSKEHGRNRVTHVSELDRSS
jgi:diguanylate cyclase (GGDEF)-like protein/PAS domain S-box-containing protein